MQFTQMPYDSTAHYAVIDNQSRGNTLRVYQRGCSHIFLFQTKLGKPFHITEALPTALSQIRLEPGTPVTLPTPYDGVVVTMYDLFPASGIDIGRKYGNYTVIGAYFDERSLTMTLYLPSDELRISMESTLEVVVSIDPQTEWIHTFVRKRKGTWCDAAWLFAGLLVWLGVYFIERALTYYPSLIADRLSWCFWLCIGVRFVMAAIWMLFFKQRMAYHFVFVYWTVGIYFLILLWMIWETLLPLIIAAALEAVLFVILFRQKKEEKTGYFDVTINSAEKLPDGTLYYTIGKDPEQYPIPAKLFNKPFMIMAEQEPEFSCTKRHIKLTKKIQ